MTIMRCWLGLDNHHGNDDGGRKGQQQLGAGGALFELSGGTLGCAALQCWTRCSPGVVTSLQPVLSVHEGRAQPWLRCCPCWPRGFLRDPPSSPQLAGPALMPSTILSTTPLECLQCLELMPINSAIVTVVSINSPAQGCSRRSCALSG